MKQSPRFMTRVRILSTAWLALLVTAPVISDTETPSTVRLDCRGQDCSLWVQTDRVGVNRLDPQSQGDPSLEFQSPVTQSNSVFHQYRHDPQDPRSLEDDRIRALLSDPDGTLWVGTLENGLERPDPASGVVPRTRTESGGQVRRRVKTPPWDTWWSHSIYTAIFIGAVSLFVRDQSRKRRHARQLQRTNAALEKEITVRKEYEEQLLHQANFDHLTELPNRFLALDRLSRAILQNRRKDSLVGVMFIDLDNFKFVNDTLGHAVGDQLLEAAAQRLSSAVRDSDTVARLGGDEFLIIAPDIDGVVAAEIAASRILECFTRPFTLGEREIFLTASTGIAVSPTDGTDPHVLLRNADTAMYKAKEHGGDSFHFFTPAMNEHAMRRLRLESNLRQALDKEELSLAYQPIVGFESRAIEGVEVLLRWNNDELDSVPPDQFIPVAEDTGMIVPIGEWVLRKACEQAVTWSRQVNREIFVTVNVSPRQFRGSDFVDFTTRALEASGLPADLLVLEISERLLMKDADETLETTNRLSEMGVRFSMDDFGTGYSALSSLRTFPFDFLKIDKSFMTHFDEGGDSRTVVETIIGMGQSLGLRITAKGVETETQVDYLLEQGCGLVQGFYFSAPVRTEELAKLLLNGHDRIRALVGSSSKEAVEVVNFRTQQRLRRALLHS